jgi:hypothetical protein
VSGRKTDWKALEPVSEVLYCDGDNPIPVMLGNIAIDIQWLETDPGTSDERRVYLRELAEEMHNRLNEKEQGYERHEVRFRVSKLTNATALNEAIETDSGKVPIAGTPPTVH